MNKTIYLLLLIVALLSAPFLAVAQTEDYVKVDVTKLSAQELQVYQKMKQAQVQAQNADVTVDKMERYAEVGRSFGVAFKECWSTVSTDAEKFAQSPAGKLTMFLIAWKIMAKDAQGITHDFIGYVVGFTLLLIVTPFWAYMTNRNCISKRARLISIERTGFWRSKRVFGEPSSPVHDDYIWGYMGCYAVFLGIVALIMFA